MTHGIFPAARQVPGLDAALAFGMAFVAAALSYYVVERPCLRWKDKPSRPENFPASRPAMVAAAAATR